MHTPHLRRADQASSSAQTTTIIVAVCVSVASAVVLLLFIRVIFRIYARRPSRSLPPVQPLARDRERRLAQLDTWQDSPHHLAAPVALRKSALIGGSKTSLLTKDLECGYQEPFRHPSFAPSDSVTDEIAVLASATPMDPSLPLPNPSFHHNSASSSSIGLSSDTDAGSSSPTPPLTPSLSHASFSQLTNTGSRSNSPSSISPARTTSQRKPRPVSAMSNASAHTTRSTRNTIRGTPHGPHSNIQIVLPAPLAPELSPYTSNDDRGSMYGRQSTYFDPSAIRRMSLADKWAPPTTRTEIPASRRRSLGSSDPRPSSTPHDTDHPPSAFGYRPPRRVSSTPHGFNEQSSPPSAFQHCSNTVPPVPLIPSAQSLASPTDTALRTTKPSLSGQRAITSLDNTNPDSPINLGVAQKRPGPTHVSSHRLQKPSRVS